MDVDLVGATVLLGVDKMVNVDSICGFTILPLLSKISGGEPYPSTRWLCNIPFLLEFEAPRKLSPDLLNYTRYHKLCIH